MPIATATSHAAHAARVPRRGFARGLWRLADPKISLASMTSILLGVCAAAHDGPLHWGWLAATVAGIFALEVAKNASGELFDFSSGADLAVAPGDRSPFSGGKRVLVDGLLTPAQTAWIASAGYSLGAAAGIGIVLWREPDVLWLGLAGVACAWFYHAPPLRLSYRGFGEAAVAICYGPLIASGAYLVQRGDITASVLLPSIPLGLMIAAFLWLNEFPDFLADRGAGKRTLVVRLGRDRAARLLPMFVLFAAVGVLALPLAGLPPLVWLGFAFLAPAMRACVLVVDHPEDTPRIIPAQRLLLIAFVVLGAGMGLGMLISA